MKSRCVVVYANEFEVEGIVATTSRWLRNTTQVDLIRRDIEAYAQVVIGAKPSACLVAFARGLCYPERRLFMPAIS